MDQQQKKWIGWKVARYCLWLATNNLNLTLQIPLSHQKFIKPVVLPQAECCVDGGNSSPGDKHCLLLTVKDKHLPIIDNSYHCIFCSQTWELWKNSSGDCIFVSPEQMPPRMIVINNDFSSGEVIGDFSKHPLKDINPLGDLEIRFFSNWLAESGDIILHASGVIMDEEGYAFIGTSGAGKSTLASILAESGAVEVLGEDQVILRYLEGQFWIFGTPWHENPAMCSPRGASLRYLFFLDRGLTPGVSKIKPLEGVTKILQTAVVPFYRPDLIPSILDRLAYLSEQVPFYTLSYQLGMDPIQIIQST